MSIIKDFLKFLNAEMICDKSDIPFLYETLGNMTLEILSFIK